MNVVINKHVDKKTFKAPYTIEHKQNKVKVSATEKTDERVL